MSAKNSQDTTTHLYLEQLKDTTATQPSAAAPPTSPVTPGAAMTMGAPSSSPPTQSRGSIDERILEENVRHERIENDIREKDQALKEHTLKWLFILLGIETLIVFGVAMFQGFHILGFALDEWSLRLLLAATLVQTVSMLTIAIRHLFPQK